MNTHTAFNLMNIKRGGDDIGSTLTAFEPTFGAVALARIGKLTNK